MNNPILAGIISALAVVVIVFSYFMKKKEAYLLFQAINMLLLAVAYLFSCEYFAMVGISVSLLRTLTFYLLERKNRNAGLWLSFLFAALSVSAFFLVNSVILAVWKPYDVICLFTLICYSFIFRIRSIGLVRYLMLLPLALSVVYNLLSAAPVLAAVSYIIELAADVLAIIKNRVKNSASDAAKI